MSDSKLSIVARVLIAAIVLSGSSSYSFADAAQSGDSPPTVEQVLEKYVQALGGRAAVQAVTTRHIRGTITAPSYGVSGTIEIYAKAPNKQLTEIQAPVVGTLHTGFDGDVAWEEENGKAKDLPGFARREADFYLPVKLREVYPRIELKGKEKIGRAEAYILEAPRRGNPKRWYFDTETGLLLRVEARNAEGKLLSREDYEDYRAVDGIRIPFTTRQVEGGLETVTKLTEVKHNVAIDDSKFKKPTARKPVGALPPAEQEAAAQLKSDTIREVTTTLASREMQGRGMGQAGGERAAKYLADRFAKVGLNPGGDKSTFLQPVKIKIETPLPETSFKVGDKVFKFKRDFALANPPSPSAKKKVTGELVFVGYGVVSDELRRDDLAGIDVKGKIVMVLKGKPGNADAAAWDKVASQRVVYGRLIKKGAAGFVEVYSGEAARFPVVAAFVSNRSVNLAGPLLQPASAARWSIELLGGEFDLPPAVLISEGAAEKIFGIKRSSFAEVKRRAEAGEFVSCDLKLRASISPRFMHEEATSNNVIGVIEGSDTKVKDEAVVYTAHYDAFGIDPEGTIYPGAADNALGVGKLVALAEVFARMNPRPRRSIVFIATTGEEYDDLGAEHWLRHPTWNVEKVAANINYDGSILEVWGKLSFILDFGFEHSDLNEVVRDIAASSGIEVVPDPVPEEGFFYRSDHYAFIKKGIPAIFLTGGPAEDPQVLFDRAGKWMATRYHTPADTVQPDWDWEGARMAAVFGLITGMRVANLETMPAWKAASPYNRSRGTTLPPPPKQ